MTRKKGNVLEKQGSTGRSGFVLVPRVENAGVSFGTTAAVVSTRRPGTGGSLPLERKTSLIFSR